MLGSTGAISLVVSAEGHRRRRFVVIVVVIIVTLSATVAAAAAATVHSRVVDVALFRCAPISIKGTTEEKESETKGTEKRRKQKSQKLFTANYKRIIDWTRSIILLPSTRLPMDRQTNVQRRLLDRYLQVRDLRLRNRVFVSIDSRRLLRSVLTTTTIINFPSNEIKFSLRHAQLEFIRQLLTI